MSIAAAAGLPHFSGSGLPGPEPRSGFRPMVEVPAPPPAAAGPSETERAVEAALAGARREFERLRAADRADHERQLAEKEHQVAGETAGLLAGQLADGLRRIGDAIAAEVAGVLVPFLEAAVRERAVAELSEALAGLLADGGAVRVRVSGPAGLTGPLAAVAEAAGAPVEVEVADRPDLLVSLDDTLVETGIAAWMERLAAAREAADV